MLNWDMTSVTSCRPHELPRPGTMGRRTPFHCKVPLLAPSQCSEESQFLEMVFPIENCVPDVKNHRRELENYQVLPPVTDKGERFQGGSRTS